MPPYGSKPACTANVFHGFPEEPSLKNIQTENFGGLPKKQSAVLQEIAKAHLESFDWAMGEGLDLALAEVEPLEFMIGKYDKPAIISRHFRHDVSQSVSDRWHLFLEGTSWFPEFHARYSVPGKSRVKICFTKAEVHPPAVSRTALNCRSLQVCIENALSRFDSSSEGRGTRHLRELFNTGTVAGLI